MRLGLIGLKGHESVVLAGARQLGDIEVVAVADDDPAELDALFKKEPLTKNAERYTDWHHLIEHTMMDVCCLCDENAIRPEQLQALAARNVHIVTEKPLATTLEGLQQVRQALAKSQSRLTMLLTMRHEAKYAAMRDLIQQGVIGTPCQATTQKSYRIEQRPAWQRERQRLGGTIPYIGIHAIDMMRWLTGLDYTDVAAFHANIGTPEFGETEDQASVLLRLSNGGSATARLDYLRPEKAPTHGDDRVRIAGTEGVIEAGTPSEMISLITAKSGPTEIKPKPTANLFVDFVQALRENRESRIAAEDCLYITEVVLRAREAADTGKLVSISPRDASAAG
jgi:predicted dehydrogenase